MLLLKKRIAIDQSKTDQGPAPGILLAWALARSCRLLPASGTSDITDAHVVICARRAGQPVITSDPGDLRDLDASLRLIAI